MATPTINLNDLIPAAPANGANVKWQSVPSVHTAGITNVSAAVVGDGNTNHFLRGDGTFAAAGGASGPGTMQRSCFLGINNGASPVMYNDYLTTMASAWGATVNLPAQAPCYQFRPSVANSAGGIFGGATWNPANNTGAFGSFFQSRITDIRFFFGFTSNLSASFMSVDLPVGGAQYAMFRYSSVASDVNFQCICSDGTSQTIVDSGVVADTATHRFALQFTSGGVLFYIDGNLVATITTHVPTSVTLGYYAGAAFASSAGCFLSVSALLVFSDI